ncbi:hypothetical protein BC938DRAFT_478623 [Jimgerdemannia flammicorona]|uniref:Uncharacterized protein n=1 Tax=Jimgerdemannia flammicorona TaxID=994334 RepID=A0A433QML4_9FUNG|nr:hypothetical protein BC938DRAFT_478623 [Jimgerdemannia flammicorona]
MEPRPIQVPRTPLHGFHKQEGEKTACWKEGETTTDYSINVIDWISKAVLTGWSFMLWEWLSEHHLTLSTSTEDNFRCHFIGHSLLFNITRLNSVFKYVVS